MYTIIRVLSHVINSTATSDHVVDCMKSYFKVVWKKRTNKNTQMQTLEHIIETNGLEMDVMGSDRDNDCNNEVVKVGPSNQSESKCCIFHLIICTTVSDAVFGM